MILKDFLELVNKAKKKRQHMETAKKVAVYAGIAAGVAAVGVAAGVLLAPKAGKETREDWKKKVSDAVSKLKHAVAPNGQVAQDVAANAAAAHESHDAKNQLHGEENKKAGLKDFMQESNKDTQEINKDKQETTKG